MLSWLGSWLEGEAGMHFRRQKCTVDRLMIRRLSTFNEPGQDDDIIVGRSQRSRDVGLSGCRDVSVLSLWTRTRAVICMVYYLRTISRVVGAWEVIERPSQAQAQAQAPLEVK